MNLSKMVEFSYKFYDFCCRTPLGVRGLKFQAEEQTYKAYGRTPLGVRGLKSLSSRQVCSSTVSHPAWGAWIEILRQ